ncbi:sigma 54-interacting transcriptional regulator [Halanaerobiaceae bacterium Z-7014]|uniref:Sigma 54-interacting transcriptional regulator n=1 Tax=Halonatronomonas betaini TaxID=2778430 RepID=A0A931AXQ4_9FIRM|nr:sigma 54-interacting transcriptional regulator [Halonatronomonas betaini]MBF8437956.1 sigma 54-interacting transcriptional regulator [Halonatronomonas betaini]
MLFTNKNIVKYCQLILDIGQKVLSEPYRLAIYEEEDKSLISANFIEENIIFNEINISFDLILNDKVIGKLIIIDENLKTFNEVERQIINDFNNIKELISETVINLLIDQILIGQAKENLNRYKETFESLPKGVITADQQGIVTMINTAAEIATGFERSKIVGKRIMNIFKGTDLIEVLNKGITFFRKEISCNTKKGQRRVLVSASPIKEGLEIKGMVATITALEDARKVLDYFADEPFNNKRPELIGESLAFKSAWNKAIKVACSSSSVMIRGESGTGKELFAQAIHKNSMRKDYNFVSINCAAIPSELLESELFGYEAGAFTGAKKGGKPGKFELAHKGTIFLDEIGDMPIDLQAKILKVIQERSFFRIGGTEEINVDIRIISATNQNLENLVQENKFREDLFFRINVIPIFLPPLRERKEDILLLANYFIDIYKDKLKKNITGLSDQAKNLLKNYDFPGNVRELENMIEYAMNMETGEKITANNLPFINNQVRIKRGITEEFNLDKAVSRVEKDLIEEALEIFGRSTAGKLDAAKKLGVSKTTLYKKLNKYNIKK